MVKVKYEGGMMKDEKRRFGNRIVAFLKSLVKRPDYLVSLLFLGAVIFTIYWLGTSVYKNFFLIQEQPFSLNLSKFREIDLLGKKDCQTYDSTVTLHINRPLYKFENQEINFNSNQNLDFQITFPSGLLSAQGYRADNSSENIKIENNSEKVTLSGKAIQLKVEYLQADTLSMTQQFCANQLIIFPTPAVRFVPWEMNFPKVVWIEQRLEPQNRIKVTISNPALSSGFAAEGFERVEFDFTADTAISIFNISATANDLQFTVPEVYEGLGTYSLNAQSEKYQFVHPVGALKFGNNEVINLDEITSRSNDTLNISRNSDEFYVRDNYLSYEEYGKVELYGYANNIILNDEEKLQPAWLKLPEYVQAGLFGFLLSIIGGLWTLRQAIGKWLLSLLPFLKPKLNLPKDSFVLVMNSGFLIAGELSRKPTKNYPYYLLKNARRKSSISGDWEKEIISEIKIRADAVDQSYVI